MRNRILTGWTVQRAIYALAGIAIMVQAIKDKEWIWLLPGIYFAAMGIFAFGCASGNCFGGNCYVEKKTVNPAATPLVSDDQKK
jgi:hypothetical protein